MLFGFLAFPPDSECGLYLLPEFGLAGLTVMLLFIDKRSDRGRIASTIFDTLPPHSLTAAYS